MEDSLSKSAQKAEKMGASSLTPRTEDVFVVFKSAAKAIGQFSNDLLEDLADKRLTTAEMLGLGIQLPALTQAVKSAWEIRKAYKRLTTSERESLFAAVAAEIDGDATKAAQLVDGVFLFAAATVGNVERQIKATRALVAAFKK